jgi:O-antigen/teichoic acid export membrane protein
VLAVAMMASAVGSPASYALASMERPRATVGATSLGAVVTVITLCIFSSQWGLPGAAYGFLAGSVVASVARWAAFLTVFARSAAHRDQLGGARACPGTEARDLSVE